ncbi:DNA-binding response regulator [Gemmobacter lutimaris]|uniref:DNA-binding response regulator n=1 Tax=Gemmobacter lutimaris TaxID=2306023 RepID=A0A398BHC7_9RHOB|nr:response regulator transcription factor [Gemmobacter lutimaris]RID89875.1 DNA-binding response regulator [Gemmobacter lutimaris]
MVTMQATDVIKILIADDHRLMSDAVGATLQAGGEFVVAKVDSREAVEEALVTPGGFDIVMLDVLMPGMIGLESVIDIIKAETKTAVVIFSGSVRPDFVVSAIQNGARGFIPKTLPLQSLAAALRLVRSGQIFLPSDILIGFGEGAAKDLDAKRNPAALTPRELRILTLVAAGKTNKIIAWEMGLSEVTVKMHLRSIFTKLGAHNRTHAVIIAQSKDII